MYGEGFSFPLRGVRALTHMATVRRCEYSLPCPPVRCVSTHLHGTPPHEVRMIIICIYFRCHIGVPNEDTLTRCAATTYKKCHLGRTRFGGRSVCQVVVPQRVSLWHGACLMRWRRGGRTAPREVARIAPHRPGGKPGNIPEGGLWLTLSDASARQQRCVPRRSPR